MSLVDEIVRSVNAKLETWSESLKSKGYRISRNKTECMFSGSQSASIDRVSHKFRNC